MISDKFTSFASKATVALNVGNAIAPGSDVIDLGASPVLRDLGAGQQAFFVLQVDTALVGAGATIKFDLLSDSTANLATSPTLHFTTGALGVATYAAGFRLAIPLPLGVTYERYLGLWMTVATANVTAGAITAGIVLDVPTWYSLPTG